MINNALPLIAKFIIVIGAVLQFGCANIVAPTGGPKDETPPVVVKSIPPNYSTHFRGQEIRVFFDEFVAITNVSNNFLSSPPLQEVPDIRLRGKSMIMSLKDTLLENVTYVFYFGESIADITEGNVIPNFQIVVSTGEYIDSLSVAGRVINSLTHQPEAGIFVMLYDNVFDSVPMLQRPVYLSKTDTSGVFAIHNMRPGNYLMFALRDLNFNFLYDLPDEKIAFIDSLIHPGYNLLMSPIEPDFPTEVTFDNVIHDTIAIIDTMYVKSIEQVPQIPVLELFLFDEKDMHQRIMSASLEKRGKVNVAFRIPADSVVINDYLGLYGDNWYIREYNAKRDTLSLWLPGITADTLTVEISDRGNILDTINVSLIPRPTRGRRISADTIPPVISLRSMHMPSGNIHPYFRHFTLKSLTPIDSADFRKIAFFINDSVPITLKPRFEDDARRRLLLEHQLLPDSAYRLLIPSGTFTDIFGNKNDSVVFNFRANNPSLYGSIIVNLRLPDSKNQYLLQLLNPTFELVAERVVNESGTYTFNHLSAGNFRLRLVHDVNRNGMWDTGNYLQKVQPEKVSVYEDVIQARTNWEVEIIWSIP